MNTFVSCMEMYQYYPLDQIAGQSGFIYFYVTLGE